MDEELVGWFEKISRRTDMPVHALVEMALWDFVNSFDWNYEELKEGAIYRGHLSAGAMPAMAES